MAHKRTGTGLIEKRNPAGANVKLDLLLFNFDFDDMKDNTLKGEHKAALDAHVVPLLAGNDDEVKLFGLASKIGDNGYNLKLSAHRIEKVAKHLQARGVKATQIKRRPLGEETSTSDHDDDARDRGVGVQVFSGEVPPAVKATTRRVTITAKSFIAFVGSRTGTMPGFTVGPPLPPPAPPVTLIPRQTLLNALGKATDASFNENPPNVAKDKHYRLFTNCRFKVVHENNTIVEVVPSALEADGGKEGEIQPPPLITGPVVLIPDGPNAVNFSWFAKGRPHPAVEPVFQTIKPRTSVFIWHIVEGRIDVSSGTVVTTATIRGSTFPSHRIFVDGLATSTVRQGVLADLWVPDALDQTKVK